MLRSLKDAGSTISNGVFSRSVFLNKAIYEPSITLWHLKKNMLVKHGNDVKMNLDTYLKVTFHCLWLPLRRAVDLKLCAGAP